MIQHLWKVPKLFHWSRVWKIPEEPREAQRCPVGTDTASQPPGVANRQGRTPHTNLRATSTFKPNPAFSGDLDVPNEGFQRAGSPLGYMIHTWTGRLPPPPFKGHILQFLFYIFNLSLLDLPSHPMPGWSLHEFRTAEHSRG